MVGGGIVGLATALKLLEQRPASRVLVIEKEEIIASHQTSNNSGVIHSGLYYKPGSLKALNCIRGYDMLVAFCRQHGVPFELCGKIVVATTENELPLLKNLFDRGQQNGLQGLRMLAAAELREYEPHVAGLSGLFVPQTGIVDYTVVAEKYAELILQRGGEIVTGEKVIRLVPEASKVVIVSSRQTRTASVVVNCAGLYSDRVAAMTSKRMNVRIIPFRGEYYKLKKEKEYLVRNLIYPVPDPAFPFLGVHFTRMMRGGVEAGPNAVLALKREGYTKSAFSLNDVAETFAWPGFRKVARRYWRTGLAEMYRSFSKAAFTKALQKLIPEITEADLVDGGAGVRAQACDREGGLVDDFLILEEQHVVNVCNAPSPAATSSLSIGETVARLALKQLDPQ